MVNREISFYFPFEFVVYEINSNTVKTNPQYFNKYMFQASLFLNYYQTLCDAGFSLPVIWIKMKTMNDTVALIFLYKIGLTLMAIFGLCWVVPPQPTAAECPGATGHLI